MAQEIGLTIEPDRNLPDLILVDLGPADALIVFVEVVATAGPVSEARQTALMAVATEAGFAAEQVAFVTAYADRDESAFKASVSELAWRSFAWFMSETGSHRGVAPWRGEQAGSASRTYGLGVGVRDRAGWWEIC